MFRFVVNPIQFRSCFSTAVSTIVSPTQLMPYKISSTKKTSTHHIMNICKLRDPIRHNYLYDEYVSNTTYNSETVNLTPLMNKYKITGAKLLMSLVNTNSDIHKVTDMTWDESQKMCGKYIDKYRNIRDSYFVCGVPSIGFQQFINYMDYDSRTKNSNGYSAFHNIIIQLLDKEMEHVYYKGEASIRNLSTKSTILADCMNIVGYSLNIYGQNDNIPLHSLPPIVRYLYDTIIKHVTHTLDDTAINITCLLNNYKISSEELYASIVCPDETYKNKIDTCKKLLSDNNNYIPSLNILFDEKNQVIYNRQGIYRSLALLVLNKLSDSCISQ